MVLNAGNNIGYDQFVDFMKSRCMISALNLTGVDFIALGARDLAAGIENVRKLAQASVADIVCANIEGFLPYIRFNRGGRKILVTSVIDPELIKLMKVNGVKAADPAVAVKHLQREISHDLLIVVIQAQGERRYEILADCVGIDLIVDGQQPNILFNLEILPAAPLVANNKKGSYVTYVDIKQDETGKTEVVKPKQIRVSAKTVAPDPQVDGLIKRYYKERQALILKRAEQHKEEIRVSQKRKFNNFYAGAGWCGKCHVEINQHWLKSRHAVAIQSLQHKGLDKDPDCFKCHVTGFGNDGASGGYSFDKNDQGMVGVQCEACHGPGGKHVLANGKESMRPVTEQGCRSCHNQTTDPDFDFTTDFKKMEHGTESAK